jgi:hypothetical protein
MAKRMLVDREMKRVEKAKLRKRKRGTARSAVWAARNVY